MAPNFIAVDQTQAMLYALKFEKLNASVLYRTHTNQQKFNTCLVYMIMRNWKDSMLSSYSYLNQWATVESL